jgi:porin
MFERHLDPIAAETGLCYAGWPHVRARFVVALIYPLLGMSEPVLAQGASDLANRGISVSVVYGGAAFTNLDGGLSRASAYSANLNLQLTIGLDRLIDWPGATLYVDGLWIQGGQPSNIVGDAQGVSNISAPSTIQVEEFWLQKNWADLPLSLLVGLYDLNSEFYRLQSAGLFLNSSFGIGPEFSQSGVGGPSIFPNTSIGARFTYKPLPGLVVRAALLDGAPVRRSDGTTAAFRSGDGALLVSEVDFLERPAPVEDQPRHRFRLGRFSMLPPYENKLAIGAWHYTATYDDPSETQPDGQPVRHRGSSGAYLIADRVVSSNPQGRTTAFLQLGLGDPEVNRFGSYLGAGLVRSGAFGGAATDQLGLGVAVARNGGHYIDHQQQQNIPVLRSETSIEFTYLRQVKPWLALQPDLQYILNPNTDPQIRNALAFTLRFEVSLGH